MIDIWKDKRKTKTERRKVLRTKVALPIQLKNEEKTMNGETLDISSSGASCFVDEPFPEFCRIEASIVFPLQSHSSDTVTVEVPVIVVNCRKVFYEKTKFRLGFYYDDLTKQFQDEIKDLIKRLKKLLREEKKQKEVEV